MTTRTHAQLTDTEYDELVAKLTHDPRVVDITLTMPAGFPVDEFVTPGPQGKVRADFADMINFVFDLGTVARGEDPLDRPVGVVPDAVASLAREVGLAAVKSE